MEARCAAFCEMAAFCAVTLGLAFGGWCLGGVLAVTLGFTFQAVASKLCFHDKSQLKESAQNVLKSSGVL